MPIQAHGHQLQGRSPDTPLGLCLDIDAADGGRVSNVNAADLEELQAGMRETPKRVPCGMLYDDRGSQLYEQITKLEEYYPFKTERDMLQQHAPEIIAHIPCGAVLVELGCGTAEKTALLLQALIQRDGADNVNFLGIDVSMEALHLAQDSLLAQCPQLRPHNTELVCAEYLGGLKEARARHPKDMLCVLWLGSSVGNLEPEAAIAFFKAMQDAAGPKTQIFLCADMWKDRNILHAAYCDKQGVTEAFIKNGLAHALVALGCEAGQAAEDWDYDVVVNNDTHQVEMWLVARRPVRGVLKGVDIAAGERVLMEVSRKFTVRDLRELAFRSGFFIQAAWRNAKYSMQMLLTPEQVLLRSWAAADDTFAGIADWRAQPIDIRHPFGFYYGHLASFSKSKLLPEEPASEMDAMLLRGIDPDVADPSQCHDHPEPPAEWPSEGKLRAYVQQVRHALLTAVQAGAVSLRCLALVVEHDAMHLETLCYMLAQEQRCRFEEQHRPSNGHAANGHAANGHAPTANGQADGHTNGKADGHANGHAANGHAPTANGHANGHGRSGFAGKPDFVMVPAGEVVLGVDVGPAAPFVWDNEGPVQAPVQVPAFAAAARPVSHADFWRFAVAEHGYARSEFWAPGSFKVFAGRGQLAPATWSVLEDGRVFVHRAHASMPLEQVAHEPVFVSLAEAEAYCRWVGGRVMSEVEWERVFEHSQRTGRPELIDEGGWEWTGTPLRAWPGFKPMPEYEEYTQDFFDGNHFVLRGSSPSTQPCCKRPSFRNWFQREYAYVHAKFRVCKS